MIIIFNNIKATAINWILVILITILGMSLLNKENNSKENGVSINVIEMVNILDTVSAATIAPTEVPSVGVIEETPLPPQPTPTISTPNSHPKVGYITTTLNVRCKPSTKSKIKTKLTYGSKVKYYKYNKKWSVIKIKKKDYYIATKYISNKKIDYKEYNIPNYSGFKSYMPYKAITSKSSPQYKLQVNHAYTGDYGIRMVNGRYCVALGSYFDCRVGQYFDLILENGEVIKCIMADEKDNRDTDGNNLFTSANKCMSEFVVDSNSLYKKIKQMGDVSYADNWNSPVVKVRIYKEVVKC